jgi:hypothetical protein
MFSNINIKIRGDWMKIIYGIITLFMVLLLVSACSKKSTDTTLPGDQNTNTGISSGKISMSQIYNYAGVKNFEYKTTAAGMTSNMKYAISSRNVNNRDTWLLSVDITTQGATVTSKTWLDKTTYACIKSSSVVTFNGQQMENAVECPKEGPNSASATAAPELTSLGTESVTVPAGTYNAKKYSLKNTVTYWYADNVPIPVKVQYSGGPEAAGGTSVSELVSWS